MINDKEQVLHNLHGDTLVYNVTSEADAAEILKQLGYTFQRVYREPIRSRRTGEIELVAGVHIYFLTGNDQHGYRDVGYFTSLCGTLFIHAEPRRWGFQIVP